MAVTPTPTAPARPSWPPSATPAAQQRTRLWIGLGAGAGVCGVAASVLELTWLGGSLTVAGLVLLMAALHRLGRSGADAELNRKLSSHSGV